MNAVLLFTMANIIYPARSYIVNGSAVNRYQAIHTLLLIRYPVANSILHSVYSHAG